MQATYPEAVPEGQTPVSVEGVLPTSRPAPVRQWARTVAFAVGAVLVVALVCTALGASLRDSLLVSAAVVLQTSAGWVLWDVTRRGQAGDIELLGVGLVLGPVLCVLAGVVGNAIVAWEWWWLAPVPIAWLMWWLVGSDVVPREQARRPGEPWWRSAWVVVTVGVLVGLVLLLLNLRRYPLGPQSVWDGYHPDVLFFEALGYSTALFGAGDSIFMSGADIRYHWLTYAWAGQLSAAFDAQPFMVLTRVLPVVALVAVVALAVALTERIARDLPDGSRRWALWLSVALVVSGGYLGAVNGTILNFDSPSQTLTSPWLMALVLIALVAVGPDARFLGAAATAGIVAFAVTGGKVSAGLVGLAGVVGAAVVGIVLRAPWRNRLVLLAAVVLVAVGAAGLLFAWGSASPGDLRFLEWSGRASTLQGLNSSPVNRGVALGTLTLLIAMGARWIAGAWLLSSREWRARPEPWVGVSLALAGALPVVFFAQGVNETWFALTASGPLAVLASVGVCVAWSRAGLGRSAAVWSVVAGVVAMIGASYVWTDQIWESGWGRFWGPWLAVAFSAAVGLVWALFRRENTVVTLLAVSTLTITIAAAGARSTPFIGALVGGARDGAGIRTAELAEPGLAGVSEVDPSNAAGATSGDTGDTGNGSGSSNDAVTQMADRPDHAWSADHAAAAAFLRARAGRSDIVATNDVNSFLVPALSRLRTYMSGVPYQSLYGSKKSVEGIPERVDVVTGVFDGSTDVAELCDAGVRWVWIATDRPLSVDPSTLGSVEFANDAVVLTDVAGKDCTS